MVLEYLEEESLWELQAMNKRLYNYFVPYLIRKVRMSINRGYFILSHSNHLQILRNQAWTTLPIHEKGGDESYYNDESPSLTESRILQINHSQILAIGGANDSPSLLPRNYNVARSCLKIDI